MQQFYSTLSGWMIPITRAMEANNINVADALKACNISFDVMTDQESRFAAESFDRLINFCNKQLSTHDFPIRIAEHFHPSTFHVLGYAMLSANTLYDALECIARYKRIVSNTCELTNYEIGDQLIFDMNICLYEQTQRPVLTLVEVETFLATITRFARELVSLKFNPDKVCFKNPKPNYDVKFLSDFFACDVEFNSDRNALYFNLAKTKEKLLGSNPLITLSHEKILNEFMARIDKNDLSHVIKNKLFEMLPQGAPSQSEIAQHLGMSLRNLQRKLHEQGTCYKEILENLRKKLALDYIEQQHLSFSEIGYLVGFSCVGNFNRAFKRWTNKTPGEYRQTH